MTRCASAAVWVLTLAGGATVQTTAGELLGPDVWTSMIGSRQAMEAQDAKARAAAEAHKSDRGSLLAALGAAKAERRDLVLNGKPVPYDLKVRISELEIEIADTKYHPTYE